MCKKGKDVDMQEKNMVPRKKGIIINAYIARWKTISCIIPIEEDFREYGTSTTTLSRERKLYTTSAIDCANSSSSSSNASCSNNSDSTAISNTFNTGSSYLSSFTPLPKNKYFDFPIQWNNFIYITWTLNYLNYDLYLHGQQKYSYWLDAMS